MGAAPNISIHIHIVDAPDPNPFGTPGWEEYEETEPGLTFGTFAQQEVEDASTSISDGSGSSAARDDDPG